MKMYNVIKYLGEDAEGLRNQGYYPVVGYSSNGFPKVLSDNLLCVEVKDEYEFIEKDDRHNFDSVDCPFHYASGSIECIDAMEAAFGKEFVKHFCIGNAFKYLWRYNKKGRPAEDISKCKRYLEMFLNLLENGSPKEN